MVAVRICVCIRSREYFQAIFDYAGVVVVHESLQTDFPEELYDVRMIALQATS